MKEQKSHARIHQVILELRQKSQQQAINAQIQKQYNISKQISISSPPTMENSEILSFSQISSQILPRGDSFHLGEKNLCRITNIISSQSLNSQREEHEICKRQIKSARPISRKKYTSKDKYSKTVTQKQQVFKISQKKSDIFEQLQILDPNYFIEEKLDLKKQTGLLKKQNDKMKQNEQKNIKAFWGKQNIFVSLFPIQYTECIVYNHPNILPVYGQVKLRQKRYVVSNQYKNSSLKDLIKQFGPFEEHLCKNYLYQIICGLQQMHNRKISHNRLHSQNILYNKEGEVFINVVKSTSRSLSQKSKIDKLFQYCPQILLTKNKSNSLKSDIWSIGILLIDMLFNFGSFNVKSLKFHPYNSDENEIQKNDMIIVDNIQQIYSQNFESKSETSIKNKIMQKYKCLSQQCKDLIKKCLSLNKQDRPAVRTLKTHRFFASLGKNK